MIGFALDRMMGLRVLMALAIAACVALPQRGAAEAVSLLGAQGGLTSSAVGPVLVSAPGGAGPPGPSLFARGAGTLVRSPLDPSPGRVDVVDRLAWLTISGGRGSQAAGIRDLIARAEAGAKGYDAVQHGARVPPPRQPTALTLAEIFAWIETTPGQPHAIGRYQVIPATLRRLVTDLGLDKGAVFSPSLQDRLADRLLAEAGLGAFLDGSLGRRGFMHNLARVWAGLPTANGKSYYHGVAGNRATMSWAQFEEQMGKIFPG